MRHDQRWGPLVRRHGPTGVPADRFAAWDRNGEQISLVAEGVDPDGFAHDPFDGTHSHSHGAMGSQGGDETHDHEHSHSNDASHDHTHNASVEGVEPFVCACGDDCRCEPGCATCDSTCSCHPTEVVAAADEKQLAVALAMRNIGKDWPEIGHALGLTTAEALDAMRLATEDALSSRTRVFLTDFNDFAIELAVHWDDSLKAFVAAGPVTAAADGPPQLVDNPGGAWHSYLCAEGLRTDEDPARELMLGACQFPDLPVSLRLQIHDEGGHYGAVTCGRIDTMERQEVNGLTLIYAEGVFGTDEHGQLGQLLVEEQTQRFVSIDPRDVDCEIVEVQVSTSGYFDPDDEPDVYDWWVRYSSLVIGAATIVATPALQQAVITMADVALPAAPLATERAPETTITIAAAGGPTLPPKGWFDDPGFHAGDPRLVRQRDGKYACPLTVTDDGQVFGHACYWGQQHTAFLNQKMTPPRSKAALAHYLTGQGVKCADGEKVEGIGQITMGMGHAPRGLAAAEAKAFYDVPAAHYDGGYGAVACADVRAGEDDFGVWISGAVRPDLTPEQFRQFQAMNLSGDWRKIAGNLELVAILAGVPVPGFPISRESLAASGAENVTSLATIAGVDADGEVLSLVAAGRVRRVSPEERLAHLESMFAEVEPLIEADRAAKRAEAMAKLAGLS